MKTTLLCGVCGKSCGRAENAAGGIKVTQRRVRTPARYLIEALANPERPYTKRPREGHAVTAYSRFDEEPPIVLCSHCNAIGQLTRKQVALVGAVGRLVVATEGKGPNRLG